MPESNRPSGEPGAPDVTVCGSPVKVHRTVSPTPTVCESGWNAKFIASTVTVAASTDPIVNTIRPAMATAQAAKRRAEPGVGR
jgi:hypothetical protein